MGAIIVKVEQKSKLFIIYHMVNKLYPKRTGPFRIVVRSVDTDLLCSPHGQGWRPREEGRAESPRHCAELALEGSRSPSRRPAWRRGGAPVKVCCADGTRRP